jgi:hypothetical protein
MQKQDFTKDLPVQLMCECCRKVIPALDWGIGRFGAAEWMGICVVKCAACNWLKIAAAGSDEDSHKQAQNMRMRLVLMLEMKPRFFARNSINSLYN